MEEEFTVNILEIMGNSVPSGRVSENGEPAGDTVRKLIEDNWDAYEKVVVLFEGVAKMTRPFMDEAFARILENRNLEEFNNKIYFPDAPDLIVRDLNAAFKLRLKIIQSKRDRELGI